MDTTTNTTVGALTAKVEKYKVIARETLRMALITPRLTKIASLEAKIACINTHIADYDHVILVENYEISKLDTEHPDYEAYKKEKTERVTRYTEGTAELQKDVEDVNKLIAEQKEGIAKIESGETKVSIDELNALVAEMVKQDALNQVK